MAAGRKTIEAGGRFCVRAVPVKMNKIQSTLPAENQNTDCDPNIRPIIGPKDTEASTRPVSRAANKL